MLQCSEEEMRALSALSRSPALKRRLLSAATPLKQGDLVPLAGQFYRVLAPAGAGMTAQVYAVESLADDQRFALKQLRAPLPFLCRLLSLEQQLAQLLEACEIVAAPVLAASDSSLLKPWYGQPTLQRLLLEAPLSPEQQTALETKLQQAAQFYQQSGWVLDLSPKNLCWCAPDWLLLDSGPKIHRSDWEALLKNPDRDSYHALIASKLHSTESRPSVLDRSLPEPALVLSGQIFLDFLYQWFPLDAQAEPDFFYAHAENPPQQRGILYRACPDFELATDHLPANRPRNRWLEARARALLRAPDTEPPAPELWAPAHTPLSFGELLRCGGNPALILPRSRLCVTPYRHWSDLQDPELKHAPTDIYCHEPLLFESALHLGGEQFELSPCPEQAFLDVLAIPGSATSERVLLILPGFRATPEAALPLIEALERQHSASLYLVACMGLYNTFGQKLLGGGSGELCLLWHLLEFLRLRWHCRAVSVIAASYACLAPVLLAGVHPLIEALVLDSPVRWPMNLLFALGRCHGQTPEQLQHRLQTAGLPAQAFESRLDLPADFPLRILHPHQDRFTTLCGRLEAPDLVFYSGSHAACLRHDAVRKGIPGAAQDALNAFFQR